MDTNTKVLALDLGCLTPEDIEWLHRLKNLATVMQVRLQIKHMDETDDWY